MKRRNSMSTDKTNRKKSSLDAYLNDDLSCSSIPMAKKIFDDNENYKVVEEIKRKV